MKFDEAAARRLVLVQAVEATDASGALLGEAERDAAEQAVLRKRHVPPGERPDPAWYLPARAEELLKTIDKRDARLVRWAQGDESWKRAGMVLPLLALVAGFGSEVVGDPHKLDLVSLPLLGVALWNIGVYVLLAVATVRGRRGMPWLAELPSWTGSSMRAQFRLLWWRTAGALERTRLQKVLHVSAAAWALGLVLWVLWIGVSKQFRFGWESTWLTERGVHWIVNLVSWPGELLFGLPGFTAADIARLKFAAGAPAVQGDAQRWGLLYVSFLFAMVVVPRLLLALLSAVRERRLARAIAFDEADPYYVRVMARVSPARVVVRAEGKEMQAVLRQAVTKTAQGDELVASASEPADVTWPPEGSTVPPCWPLDGELRDSLLASVPEWKRAGTERLVQAWAAEHESRWMQSVQLLGTTLAESARDSEKLQGMLPGAKAREAAMASLLQRLHDRMSAAHLQLLRLFGVDGLLPAHGVESGETGWALLVNQGTVGAAGAMAGAAAGALAGAKIDLLTGGLTMGAGAAVGALIGGAGLFSAARWRDWGGSVRFNDEQVQSIAEALVLQYLAVIHAGRSELAEVPAQWRSEAVAAVAADASAFVASATSFEEPLRRSIARALRAIYPGGDLYCMGEQ